MHFNSMQFHGICHKHLTDFFHEKFSMKFHGIQNFMNSRNDFRQGGGGGTAGETRPEPRRLEERAGWWPMSQTRPQADVR
jgi:hypothetical protein